MAQRGEVNCRIRYIAEEIKCKIHNGNTLWHEIYICHLCKCKTLDANLMLQFNCQEKYSHHSKPDIYICLNCALKENISL
jgi:hypothetical protein